jgi:hypothetical protein
MKRPAMAVRHMMTMKAIYTALGTPLSESLFLEMSSGIMPPIISPPARRPNPIVTYNPFSFSSGYDSIMYPLVTKTRPAETPMQMDEKYGKAARPVLLRYQRPPT